MAMKKTTTKNKSAADSDQPDHPGGSATTTDHDTIKNWAEMRGAKPAAADGTERGPDDAGLIRLEFPDAPNANDAHLHEITWDEFFQKFDEGGLALLYQEETAAGVPSMFNRFVKRETAAAKATAAKKTTAKKTTAKKTTAPTKSAAKKTTAAQPAANKGKSMAKTTAKKSTTTAKKSAPAKASAKKAAPTAKKAPAAKKTAAKKAPAATAKKTAAKKTSAKKVPAARGYRGR